MAVVSYPRIPTGTVVEAVPGHSFLFLVNSQDFGSIQVRMTSLDPVNVGDRIFVIPLHGGSVVGVTLTHPGLEGLSAEEICPSVGGV